MRKVQVRLQSDDRVRTCWVEPKVKIGNRITLKNSEDPDRMWTVLSVGEPTEMNEIHTEWNVGGVTSIR